MKVLRIKTLHEEPYIFLGPIGLPCWSWLIVAMLIVFSAFAK